ncbi:MAG TPA: histidine phosphatase family protein [Geodermatophilus sp.]|nr:histidine phosphatase family protein [Geodermatophilus sp.]
MTAEAPPTPPVPRLVIWRHGRTEWNATGRFQGQMDPPLDDHGRSQAARAAPYLVAGGLSADDTVVVSSDLSRAAETAAALTALLGVPLRLDPRLREHGMGSWEGLTREEVAARHPEQYADWLAGRPVRGRGGEAAAAVAERALAAVRELPQAAVAVLVTHGGTAARLVEALLGLGPEHRRLFGPLGNCAWSELAFQSTGWRLLRHNMAAAPLPEAAGAEKAAAEPAAPAPFDAGASPEEGAPVHTQDADAVL